MPSQNAEMFNASNQGLHLCVCRALCHFFRAALPRVHEIFGAHAPVT